MGEMLTKRLQKTAYRGKQIYYADYRGLVGTELSRQVRENGKAHVEAAMGGDRDQLSLVDVRGCFPTPEILSAFQEVAVEVAPYTKAAAIVGLQEHNIGLLEFVNRMSSIGARSFETIDEAMDWLFNQAV